MGCFNGTCAMSHLPITWDDEVYVWFFVDNKGSEGVSASNMVYSDDHFSLLGIPFRAKYNDYGAWDDVFPEDQEAYDLTLRMIENGMRDDKPSTPLDTETIQDLLHNCKLNVKVYNDQFQVGFMMILRSVFDKFLNEYSWKEYVPHPTDWLQAKYMPVSFDVDFGANMIMADIIEAKEQRNDSLLMAFELVRRRYHLNFMHYVMDIADVVTDDNLKTVCRGLYLNMVLNNLANKLRMSYGPCSGSGSQSADYDAYKVLASSMIKIISDNERDHEEE
jgi:hypothetical protein